MDHGSHRDEPVSRSGPFPDPLDHRDHLDYLDRLQHRRDYDQDQSPLSPLEPQHQHQYQYLDRFDDLRLHDFPDLCSFSADDIAPAHAPAHASQSLDDAVDPADFYRSYQSVQQTTEIAESAGHASPPVTDPMAPAAPSSTRQPPSLRSNGNGTTPKHPAVPVSHRGALRPGQRSLSNPVDSRSGGLGTGGTRSRATAEGGRGTTDNTPPSVRDLKKKFDQSAPQPTSSPRKTTTRSSTRDAAPTSVNGKSPSVGGAAASHGSPRTSMTRDIGRDMRKSSGTRSGQRSRPTIEDPDSGNSQSFASRISRPRTAGSPTAKSSKSAAQPAPLRQTGLLFGEILPEQSDSVTPGFGIEPARPRRTSESNVTDPVRPHVRTLSDPDIEPPSPTDWYRAIAPLAAQQSTDHHVSRIPKSQHSRAHSDLAGSKLALTRPDYGVATRDIDSSIPPTSPISPTSPTSPTSRLPILSRRMNDASSHGSPLSTRPSSPSTFNKPSVPSGRTSRQHTSLNSRARTPTTSSGPKSSHRSSSSTRKAPPPNLSASQTSSRLNAFVSVPPAKLSPSLRSSRPRQSVATATTAASRQRAVDRGTSPLRQPQRPASRTDGSTSRRRKVSAGPIDFAQRRETIKLAYSKSIRETQAREARQAAAEKRKRESDAAARAKAEAEAAAAARVANAAADARTTAPKEADGNGPPLEANAEQELSELQQPQVETEMSSTLQQPAKELHAPLDSLKLEIPGSFPGAGTAIGEPNGDLVSAVSMTSGVTEFDTEVQTELPRQEIPMSLGDPLGGGTAPNLGQAAPLSEALEQLPERTVTPALHKRASYRSPFDDEGDEDDEDDSVSIKISLDPASLSQPQASPELTPTRATFEAQTEHPTAPPLAEDDEYVPRPYTFSDHYETTVTILGPEPDFRPSHKEPPRATTSQTNLPQADEPPAAGTPDIIVPEISNVRDVPIGEPQIEIETPEHIEDFYTGPRLHDNIAALRDSTLTSSNPSTPFDGRPPSAEYQSLLGMPHTLPVPGLLAPGNRSSQHSAWTDFSFGSEDRDAGHPSSTSQSHGVDTHDDGASFRAVPSTGDLSTCASSLGELTQSPESSPLEKSGATPFHLIPEFPGSQQHLPEPANAGTFTPRSSESETGKIAPIPERDPPQPPVTEREYERDTTLYLSESRPESYAYSHEGDLSGTVSSPQSLSQLRLDQEPSRVSLGEAPYDGQTPLTEKEKEEQKRLRQRQLVIRELIDTEDAFVRDMTVVEEIYKGTAEACPNLDNKTVKLIFRNTDEIIAFHAALLVEFKEGASSVYTPKGRRSPHPMPDAKDSDAATAHSSFPSNRPEQNDEKDRLTVLGHVFTKNIEQLKAVHEMYLRSSDSSSKRLVQIQEDKTVMLWLNECNEVAKELTSAWNLDSLLIKPMQRITKYPDIITHLLKYTPEDHPDRESLINARTQVIDAIDEINKTKKNFELVGQIVSNRKRKESDVRAGIARAFGKRVDKLQVSAATKTAEDDEYRKLQQQFGDDYLRLQVVLRDVEYYTRNVATYVHEFLQYLSSMELVMRLQPSRDYAHLESKWVQFNVSMRDIEKIVLERHLADVRKHVIEPFEQVIRCYGNPSLAMKKRAKRRLDYERYMALKANGKKVDKQLAEQVEQYEALNDTLKKELPKLSAMTAKIGNICLGKFISIQAAWFAIWKEKVKAPLSDVAHVPEVSEIVSSFQREFALQEERAKALGIVNPTLKGRGSQSTTDDSSSIRSKTRSRPSDILSTRGRGMSVNSDHVPVLPTPDFVKRNSGQFSLSPASSALPSPANYYRDYYSGINGGNARGSSGSPITPAEPTSGSRPAVGVGLPAMRPSTGRSFDSASLPRQSSDSAAAMSSTNRRDSNSTFNSSYPAYSAGAEQQTRRLSGLFSSALPLPDGPEERSARSSRASSRDRGGAGGVGSGYNVLWLAASLFEFNIETTKHEAGYPYLTYQAGEIFDVIAEKGELWLAKNQDDPREVVGWIWSKHFAKLADS
ncbi:hypothetical protein C7999DRAFT_10504 [Corynascus novoguineensis]|uniref:DH domain-containing protein n=1 Tax=Corynascus novoguineensis TaxID=1126955 RepID=A0AAN7HV29_9PEZI|nr:hypothetical protein C7999DRAFT_10504 [Corynascus novoguineensis]